MGDKRKMNKEELEKEAEDNKPPYAFCALDTNCELWKDGYKKGAEPREKRIADLEEKISVLLSCKNCPENKGGLICQKEYENKCLTQKIQYIKELQEEIAELKKETRCECTRCVYSDSPCIRSDYGKDKDGICDHFKDVFDENAELKKKVEKHKWNDIFLEENAFYDKVIAEEYTTLQERIKQLEKENAELRAIAENQQSSNMSRYFENKKLKEGLAVGSTWNKHLNSLNKELEEERDRYRNMTFDQREQLTKAKELLKKWVEYFKPKGGNIPPTPIQVDTEQFLKDSEVKK